jgi:hypothetical protein
MLPKPMNPTVSIFAPIAALIDCQLQLIAKH